MTTSVYVSKERVEAMKMMGVWDDPATRARLLRSYAEYHAQQQNYVPESVARSEPKRISAVAHFGFGGRAE